jgi:CBS domain containing-hemolysin-like protein
MRRMRWVVAEVLVAPMLAGAQLGITICSLLLGALAEPAIAHLIEAAISGVVQLPEGVVHAIGFTIALSLVVFLHMVVGEMTPKSWASLTRVFCARPRPTVPRLRPCVRPVIHLLNLTANGVVRLVEVEPRNEMAMVHAPTDLLLLLEEFAGHGAIAADEHRLLTRTIELSGLDARAAMTPRRDIVSIDAAESATAWLQSPESLDDHESWSTTMTSTTSSAPSTPRTSSS